jgi:pimeloyl-ACP methyl ester carboxylesterase
MTRNASGRRLTACGNEIYLEESGSGDTCVVFESGAGAGRMLWDPVVPLVGDIARTVAYDRAGRGRSGPATSPQSLDDMADTLVALIEALAPSRLILVAHSMGGLVVRRAIERLSPHPAGLVLVDSTPEAAPIYDDWSATARQTDRILAAQQALAHSRTLMRMLTRPYGRMFPVDTYEAMLIDDFSPAGIAQNRREIAAVATGIDEFRSRPPKPPHCDIVLISASRADRMHARNHGAIREYQRRYAEQVGARFEDADCEHVVPAEKPEQVAAAIRRLATA